MRIYKFKDLTDESKHPHFLQIVLGNSVWCASPDCLNDKDEFRFTFDYSPSPLTCQLLTQVMAQYGKSFIPPDLSASLALKNDRLRIIVRGIFDSTMEECRASLGITSFSATKDEERLWEEYGGEGNGACVEIIIPDHLLGTIYHRVCYVREKVFHIDTVLESALYHDKADHAYRNMLLTKTKKWEHEQEIRLVGQRQNINWVFDGYVSEVTFGQKVPSKTLEQLTADIADRCYANNIKIVHRS